ncbi:hypothetical protein EB118_25435, partial [bacterium]|nr:hypothetical protein [bacterium]
MYSNLTCKNGAGYDPSLNIVLTDNSFVNKKYLNAFRDLSNNIFTDISSNSISTNFFISRGRAGYDPSLNYNDPSYNLTDDSFANKKYVDDMIKDLEILQMKNFGKFWDFKNLSIISTRSFAISSNGKYQYITSTDGIRVSTDYGVNFNLSSAPNTTFNYISCDSTGKYVTAVINNGTTYYGIYISNDYGTTWRQARMIDNTLTPNQYYNAISVSGNGRYQVVVIMMLLPSNSSVYVSNNYGENWSNVIPNPSSNSWVSINYSGQYQSIVAFNVEPPKYSHDYGLTWNKARDMSNNILPNGEWSSIAVSSTGQYQTATIKANTANSSTNIYYSTNYGVNWSIAKLIDDTNLPSVSYVNVGMSADGQYQVCVAYNNNIFYSTNFGKNWTRNTSVTGLFNSVSLTHKGINTLVLTQDSKIY